MAEYKDDLEFVVLISNGLKELLTTHLKAEGEGFWQCVSNVKDELPKALHNELIFINFVRNRVVHYEEFIEKYDSRVDFIESCEKVKSQLMKFCEQYKPKGELSNVCITEENRWITIKFDFTVENHWHKRCKAIALFYFDGDEYVQLKDFNGEYCDEDGQVAVSEDFNPIYKVSVFKDFELVIPVSEFHLAKKSTYELVVEIHLYSYRLNEYFCSSGFYNFEV